MGRIATSLEDQIELLVKRGMVVEDKDYARRKLEDLGYYHLGFYWHAFEEANLEHQFKANTRFEDVVGLYEFEFNLKQLLLKYLRRIEINLRTKIIASLSLAYSQNPAWFVDKTVVTSKFIKGFDQKVYTDRFKQDNSMIQKHHAKHQDQYAPAWKTLEYMSLGQIVKLYCALKEIKDKSAICECYGIHNPQVFTTYLWAICETRNRCAHSNVLYDMNLRESISNGPAGKMNSQNKNKISGVIQVIEYMVGQIELTLQEEFRDEISKLSNCYTMMEGISPIVKSVVG